MADHDHQPGTTDISRRGFLKGVGAGAVATGLISSTTTRPKAKAQGKGDLQGPGEVSISLNVNGKDQKLSVEPRVTLLDALRKRLDTTGTKTV